MKITLSRRTAVRAISYLAAAFGVAAGIASAARCGARLPRQLENTYTRALGDLSSYLVNISNDLEKGASWHKRAVRADGCAYLA